MKHNIETRGKKGAVRRLVMVGRGKKCRSHSALSCENENKSQSQGCACQGKITAKSETAVSILVVFCRGNGNVCIFLNEESCFQNSQI